MIRSTLTKSIFAALFTCLIVPAAAMAQGTSGKMAAPTEQPAAEEPAPVVEKPPVVVEKPAVVEKPVVVEKPAVVEKPVKKTVEPAAELKTEKPAEDAVEWEQHISIRPRAEGRLNHHFNLTPDVLNLNKPDTVDAVSQQSRFELKAKWKQFQGHLVVQHVAVWGANGGNALTDGTAGVHIAYFTASPTKALSFDVGRLTLAYGDQRVLGAVGWHQVGRAWDAGRLRAKLGKAKVDVFVAQHTEGTLSPTADDGSSRFTGETLDEDGYLSGLYVRLGDLAKVKNLDVYVLHDTTFDNSDDAENERRSLTTAGALFKGKFGPADVMVEGAFQTGSMCVEGPGGLCTDQTIDASAFFVDTEAGFTIAKKARVFAGFSMASGDDPETEAFEGYNHLYPTAHKFLGLSDIAGARTNLQEIRAGGKLKLSKQWSLAETAHLFTRLQPESETLGIEFDTVLWYKHSKHFNVGAGHALFLPDEGTTNNDQDAEGTAHWMFLQAKATF